MNGNNGFVGDLLSQTIFLDILNINKDFSYYSLIIFVFLLFLLSSDFKLFYVKKIFYFVINLFSRNTKNISTDKKLNENELKDESTNQNRIQENLFNINKNTNMNNDIKLKLPLIDFLKKPEKSLNKKEDIKIDAEGLEKILLDFGVEGKIKKISHGPVVSLNEFEPAVVKVRKY